MKFEFKKRKWTIIILAAILLIIYNSKSKHQYKFNITQFNSENPNKSNIKLISTNGSSRATAYGNINKIAFQNDFAFIGWLSIKDSKFKPVITVYSLTDKIIKFNYSFDESFDNHGVPSIVIDNQKRIHLFYYPHINHAIKYRTGNINKDGSIKWFSKSIIDPEEFTYPSAYFHKKHGVVVGARSTPIMKGPNPLGRYSLISINDKSIHSQNVLSSSYGGYSSFTPRIALSNSKIHLVARFHENSSSKYYGGNQSLVYLKKDALKDNWSNMNNNVIKYNDNGLYNWENINLNNLITSHDAPQIDQGGTKVDKSNLYISGFKAGNNDNIDLFYIKESLTESNFFHFFKNPNKKDSSIWKKENLTFLKKYNPNKRFTCPTGNMQKYKNDIYISGLIQDDELQRKKYSICLWGENSNSVIIFSNKNGKFEVLREFYNPLNSVWFPQIKIHNGQLILIFTKGYSDKGNNNSLNKTQVYLFHESLKVLENQKEPIQHKI